ncbi:MAG: 1-deoxy-D-xylulose-5-phosphate reductoisomerase [Pirellulaceae bacterium]|nr:1-deoxy-D-xylulose-5-phosphate reductoisomerase [Pirellulaceae bacterium]
MQTPRTIAIFGATGSIGRSAIEVAVASEKRQKVVALSGHSHLELLLRQAQLLKPRWVIATNLQKAKAFDFSTLPPETELLLGEESLNKIAQHPEVDLVLTAIVGSAGLQSTLSAIEGGKIVAIANKEPLVMAGPIVTEKARRTGATLLPVDSEHSAIFQAMKSGRKEEVAKIILTASGGPFRNCSKKDLSKVTIEEALDHPTWKMGSKITIDSATMMNKALEIIEARWLFNLPAEKIEAVIHPQSVIHSFVEFFDGSVIAQLSPPDMKLPIQYAFDYPDRKEGVAKKVDWSTAFSFDFFPPDSDRFPALRLGHEVAKAGGTAGAVLNAANEVAVEQFLSGSMAFDQIVPTCEAILKNHPFEKNPSLDTIIKLDRWARCELGPQTT